MTLSDLASLGSFISGLAVLVSLIFLYYQLKQVGEQVKQAERNQRAALTQGYVNRATETNRWSIDSGMLALLTRARTDETNFSRDEVSYLATWLRMIILNAQDSFLAHREGLIDQATLDVAMRTVRRHLALPVMRALWLVNARDFFASDFQEEVERMIAETPLVQTGDDTMERFQAALAKLKG